MPKFAPFEKHLSERGKILFADVNHPVLHETLQAAGFACDLSWDKTVKELEELLPGYDGLVIRSRFPVTRGLLDKCPRLRCIGRVGAGMENIDAQYAVSRGIVCVSAPEGNRDAVGEHALGMLLMLLNRIKIADAEVRRGTWLRAENRGTEIMGKTVGIIGYGNTGAAFARKLSGFDCRILAYDKYKSGFGGGHVTETDMEELFRESDIISLHVPQIAETRYLVNASFIDRCQKPFYLVNTARGACVNTADLVHAIESGKILGACLDVLEYEHASFENIRLDEPSKIPPPLQYLINSEKVVLTPHIGGWTHESNYKMSRIVAERMIKALG